MILIIYNKHIFHFILGGTEDIEHLPIQMFRKGIVGCVGELSVGRVYEIDMIQRAKDGQNVDTCLAHNISNDVVN